MARRRQAATSTSVPPRTISCRSRSRRSYQREDDRWSGSSQLRDWLILFAIGALHFAWMFMVFLLEPGIR